MRRDEPLVRTLLAHGADPQARLQTWTPTRRQSSDFHFEPELVGATPYWLAARFWQPNVMRLLVELGADPLFVHRSDRVVDGKDGRAYEHRYDATTALMAAVGMGGGGNAWVPPDRSQREALALDTVKLAVDLGIDVNATNTDGRTALDAAKALKVRDRRHISRVEGRQAWRDGEDREAASALTASMPVAGASVPPSSAQQPAVVIPDSGGGFSTSCGMTRVNWPRCISSRPFPPRPVTSYFAVLIVCSAPRLVSTRMMSRSPLDAMKPSTRSFPPSLMRITPLPGPER